MQVQTLKRIRPNFRADQLTLSKSPYENSYLPDELAPHTAQAVLALAKDGESMDCFLKFEYSIDEDSGGIFVIAPGISIRLGKFSSKILETTVNFSSIEQLIQKVEQLTTYLETTKNVTAKQSHKKSIELIHSIVTAFNRDLMADAKLRDSVKNILELETMSTPLGLAA